MARARDRTKESWIGGAAVEGEGASLCRVTRRPRRRLSISSICGGGTVARSLDGTLGDIADRARMPRARVMTADDDGPDARAER